MPLPLPTAADLSTPTEATLLKLAPRHPTQPDSPPSALPLGQGPVPVTDPEPDPVTPPELDIPAELADPAETSPVEAIPPPDFPVEAPSENLNTDIPEVPTVLFPEAATPEPFWFNGGLTSTGELLSPTQPTNRLDVPLDLTADYQDYKPLQQTVTAQGNVLLRLNNGVLTADRLWANLVNRYVLVEGNVVFQRGQQLIRAERGEYTLLQGEGTLFDARGSLFLPELGGDLEVTAREETASDTPSIVDLLQEGTINNVRTTGEITFGTGNEARLGAGGPGIRRIRFEAERVDFDAEGSIARNIRITNDPFSPPELEIRGDAATLTRLNEFEDELVIENGKLVLDQRFKLPLLRSRILFSRRQTDDVTPFSIGFDGEDRDGLFLERTFRVYDLPPWSLRVTPQLLVQRFLTDRDTAPSNFGLEVDLDGQLGPTTQLRAGASFSGLDLDKFDDRLRASVRLQQAIGTPIGTHSLNLEYSFRDRLFNGSLGFQDVQSSIGAVLLSPNITLGDTGVVLRYQASAQFVTAETDRKVLLDPFENEGLVSLGRFQGSISADRVFTLWRGQPLPPTAEEGLRYTPRPVVPNLQLIVGGRGTFTYYTSDNTQESWFAILGIRGQLGHFSRAFLDSTQFELFYRQSLIGDDTSPFRFDRDVDRSVLSGGIIQQLFGPVRLGVRASVNLDTQELISTDYILEYSRRTYGVLVRFNPIRETGFIGFRLSDFDWSGRAARFGGADIRDVEGGVIR